jgi:MFS family permease
MEKWLRNNKTPFFYLLFRFFQDFALVYPVYMILFRETGLDHLQTASLLAIWAVAMMALEIPSGIIADIWSRKATVAIGQLLKGSGFLLWLLFPSYWGFAGGFILWGFQEALSSGTVEALLYDALKSEGRADRFVAISGWGLFVSRAAVLVSVGLGAVLYAGFPDLVLFLSAFSMAIASLLVLGVHEESGGGSVSEAETGGSSPVAGIGLAVREALKVKGIIPLILFWSLAGAAYGVLDEYDFLFARFRGVPLAMVGLWGAFRFAMEAAGGALAFQLEYWFSLSRPRALYLWGLAASVLLFLGVVTGNRILLAGYFLFFFFMAAGEVIYQGMLQDRISSSGRATVSSLASFFYTGSGIIIILVFGYVAEHFDLAALMLAGASLAALSSGVMLLVDRKGKGSS